MGQVTIYLDQETEQKARAAARSRGVSLSSWVAQAVQRNARTEWPEFVRELAGAWDDAPASGARRRTKGRDAPRGRL